MLFKMRNEGTDWPPTGITMIGLKRLLNLRQAILTTVCGNVPGDVVELGVWRGGAMIYARAVLNQLESDRKVHLFDAFAPIEGYSGAAPFLSTDIDRVKASAKAYGLDQGLEYHKGFFNSSLPVFIKDPKWTNTKISVLRVWKLL